MQKKKKQKQKKGRGGGGESDGEVLYTFLIVLKISMFFLHPVSLRPRKTYFRDVWKCLSPE